MANTSSTGGASTVTVYILGNATSAIRAMRETSAAASETESRLSKAGKGMKSLGSNMTQLGYSLSRVSVPLALLGGYAIKSAVDFQSSMTLLQTQAGASAKEVNYLTDAVVNLKNSQLAPKQLAEGLYYIRSEGYKGAEAINVLKAAMAGAEISGADLTTTARGLTAVIKTDLPGAANTASNRMNELDSIVGAGSLKWEELNTALSTGFLATVKKTGLSLGDIGNAFDAFSRRLTPPTQSATNFRKALIQMIDLTATGRKSLASIGISQYELAEDLKKHGLTYALEDLETHLKKVGEAEGTAILGQAFGRSKGAGTIFELLETTQEQKKIAKERAKYASLQHNLAIQERTDQAKIKIAIVEVQKTLIGLGNVLIPVVIPMFTKLAKLLQEAAHWFTNLPKPIKEIGTYLGIAAVLGGPLLILFGNLLKVGGGIFSLVGRLTSILPGFGAAAGAAGTEASAGIAGLLPEIAALTLAAAGIVTAYKAIKAVKEFFESSPGKAKTPGAKAFKKFRQPSEFTANTSGALKMFEGGPPSRINFEALAPGSAQEAKVLFEHTGTVKGEAGGKAAAETAEGRAFRQRIEQRNEQIILHAKIDIDGKQVGASTLKYARDHPTSPQAKWLAEAVNRTAKSEASRGSHG